jgi:hypothetical protein
VIGLGTSLLTLPQDVMISEQFSRDEHSGLAGDQNRDIVGKCSSLIEGASLAA